MKDKKQKMLEIGSLGAGRQSSCMQFMSDHGLIQPPLDHNIFANTGGEPDGVIEYFKYIQTVAKQPVHEVTHRDGLKKGLEDSVNFGTRVASIPLFTKPKEGKKGGMLWRQCTTEYKVMPVQRKIKEILGLKPRARLPKEPVVSLWLGISIDEAQRMKPSRVNYIQHRYPLIELGMSAQDCVDWIKEHGYKDPVKSACTFCPYHSDSAWRELKNSDHNSFQEAVKMDELLRNGIAKTKDQLYLHRSLKPLSEVDFRTAEDAGQADMFGNECEGHCGL